MSDIATDYKSTVFLPRTNFPMRGELPRREPELLRRWAAMGLWQELRAAALGREKFILHDGPPYANGHLHIGHALNKIHKDVINRAQQMAGRDANYIPGWDCHGLPIEWKVEEQYRKAGKDKDQVPVLEFRKECRDYAQHWLDVQAEEFKRLGIAGDWANRYATMDFSSEAAIANEIHQFVRNDELYRGLRPVMWSPVEKTALAEAEIEYQDKKDTAIWVRFRVVRATNSTDRNIDQNPNGVLQGASIIIWTTTPWTIPANRAVAFNPAFRYSVIEVISKENNLLFDGERLVVASNLVEKFKSEVGITEYKTVHEYLEGVLGRLPVFLEHPLARKGYDRFGEFKVLGLIELLPASFVTTEVGTGFVHIAPAHGEDDFALAFDKGIAVLETVGDDGIYYADVPLFAGLHVYKAADPVCRELEQAGSLVKRSEIVHSYPHSWRSKAPLIYRATAQWFIRMDGSKRIRQNALDAIEETHFVPEQGKNRIRSMVESRPDWCISRQRAWGVPIAIFVKKATRETLRDPAVFHRIVNIFAEEGADSWYQRGPEDFLGPAYDPADYEQVFDIVDVWFESGSTHAFVLEARGLPTPADLYLEGSDQHRGWFQASLLESIGTRGTAPFKTIVTDGFVLDEHGRKMSKSLGNVTAPQEVNDKYGADILRLWVMNSDISEDLRIGPEILKQQAELYRRLRNTLRWLLGSLDGFTDEEKLPEPDFPELERLILHRLWELNAHIMRAVDTHDWTGVYPALHNFCATDLSAFYFDIRKDSLYCDRPDAKKRRACRTLLDILHRTLTAWLAPALPFTAEDSWTARFGEKSSVHETLFVKVADDWRDDGLAKKWTAMREIRAGVTREIEQLRRDKKVGSSLQAWVTLYPDRLDHVFIDRESLDDTLEVWADILIVSKVDINWQTAGTGSPINGVSYCVDVSTEKKCERCWRVLEEVGTNHHHPTLCRRCVEAIA